MTTARPRGAIELCIARITQNASGSMVGNYPPMEREPLCDVAMKLPGSVGTHRRSAYADPQNEKTG
jgi:hypothetical protein